MCLAAACTFFAISESSASTSCSSTFLSLSFPCFLLSSSSESESMLICHNAASNYQHELKNVAHTNCAEKLIPNQIHALVDDLS